MADITCDIIYELRVVLRCFVRRRCRSYRRPRGCFGKRHLYVIIDMTEYHNSICIIRDFIGYFIRTLSISSSWITFAVVMVLSGVHRIQPTFNTVHSPVLQNTSKYSR